MAAQGEDPTWHLMLFLAVLFGLFWALWHFFQAEILEGLRYIRLAELWIIGLVDSRASACFTWLQQAQIGNKIPSNEALRATAECYGLDNLKGLTAVEALQYYNLSPASMNAVTGLIARYMRWLAVIICFLVGGYALYGTPRNKFTVRHDLESFIKIQSKMWPFISPIVNFIPSRSSARIPGDTVPDKLPPFAEAFTPEEWISWHRIPVSNGIPDRERVRRAMLLQLGPAWQGIDNLPPYLLGLFAAFALKGVQKRDESEDLLGRLAMAWSAEKGLVFTPELYAEVKKVARDPSIGGEAETIAGKHAYRTTALLGVLKWARYTGGVLAPAHFLWLRAVDRTLWYPLNNLGRRSFHTEGAGALAHFMAEEAAGKPLPIPRIDTAIVALNQYLAANPAAKIPPREEPKGIRLFRRS